MVSVKLGVTSYIDLRMVNQESEESYINLLQPAIILSGDSQLVESTGLHLLTGVLNTVPGREESVEEKP